jgi:hypothetical protein
MSLHPQAKAFLKAQESLDAPDITTNLVEYRAMSHLEDELAGPLTPGVRIEHSRIISRAGFKFASSVFAKLFKAAISVFSAVVAAARTFDKSAIDHPINS